jgi:hypothetical protein
MNVILESCNQNIRVTNFTPTEMILSNGVKFVTQTERNRFMKAFHKDNTSFVQHKIIHYDVLFGLDEEQAKLLKQRLRSEAASKGGIRVQELHKDHITASRNKNGPWNKGLTKETDSRIKGWTAGLTKYDHPSLMKLAQNQLGENNSYHKSSQETKQRVADHNSHMMLERIANGTFTPHIHNSYTRCTACVFGHKFRSSWEAAFWYKNQNLEYESLRIPYVLDEKRRTYIADFVDDKNKIVYEIKPSSKIKEQLVKIEAASKYCSENNFQFVLLDETEIRKLVKTFCESDFLHFDEKTRKALKKIYHENKTHSRD